MAKSRSALLLLCGLALAATAAGSAEPADAAGKMNLTAGGLLSHEYRQ